ncbi:MAG: hypothetical protein GY845_05515 [Planctomycetes bacterium]|nr:hypothetical protein [Planctomycetota bacterium]
MKHLPVRTLVAIVVSVVFSAGCAEPMNQAGPTAGISTNLSALGPELIGDRAERPAFKGIELYSWQNGSGQWCFSLLYGTNRNKFYREVTSPELTILGLKELKTRLGSLAKGESVFWLAGTFDEPKDASPKLTQPPEDIIKQVVAYGKQQDVAVHVTRRGAQ